MSKRFFWFLPFLCAPLLLACDSTATYSINNLSSQALVTRLSPHSCEYRGKLDDGARELRIEPNSKVTYHLIVGSNSAKRCVYVFTEARRVILVLPYEYQATYAVPADAVASDSLFPVVHEPSI